MDKIFQQYMSRPEAETHADCLLKSCFYYHHKHTAIPYRYNSFSVLQCNIKIGNSVLKIAFKQEEEE
jgi:hypothetical protein